MASTSRAVPPGKKRRCRMKGYPEDLASVLAQHDGQAAKKGNKIKRMSAEEYLMDKINLEAAYSNLANAVVEKAARDYKSALKVLKRRNTDEKALRLKEDCEKFFRGEIEMYSDLDGKYIMTQIQKGVEGGGEKAWKEKS